jgi:hypothetical protein
MTRLYYYKLCQEQETSWLEKCAATPAKGMTKLDVATIKLVLKERKNGD